MPTNQDERHRAFRNLAGTTLTFDGDLIAACQNLTGLSGGSANQNLIAALQQALSSTATNINNLKAEAAISAGYTNWQSMGYDDINTLLASFSPLDLSPVLWLDTTLSTITSIGGAVSQIDDLSGNGNHFKQGTASLQPTDDTATINGLIALDFLSDSMIPDTPITFAGDFTYAFVLKHDVASLDAFAGNAIVSNDYFTEWTGVFRYNLAGAGQVTTALAFPTATDTLIIIRRTGSDVISELNGTEETESAYTSGTTTFSEIGSASGIPDWDGAMSHVLLVPSYVTGDDFTALKSYINGIWGV